MAIVARSLPFVAALAAAGAARADTIVALTTDNRLLSFDHTNSQMLFTNVAVTGLQSGESLIGIDFRPQTREVYGVGTANIIYRLDFYTGAAAAVGPAFSPGLDLSAEYGIDFNPTVDRMRVVNSTGNNRRLNPITGAAVATDTMLAYADGSGTPRAVGVAYTNSVAGALPGSTRQFIIDSARDLLVETGSQAGGNPSFNGGLVTAVGPLGVDTGDLVGFDISGDTGIALLSTTPDGGSLSTLRLLNLNDGSTTFLGDIAGGTIRDITLVPAPGALALAGAAGLAGLRRRRAN